MDYGNPHEQPREVPQKAFAAPLFEDGAAESLGHAASRLRAGAPEVGQMEGWRSRALELVEEAVRVIERGRIVEVE